MRGASFYRVESIERPALTAGAGPELGAVVALELGRVAGAARSLRRMPGLAWVLDNHRSAGAGRPELLGGIERPELAPGPQYNRGRARCAL